MDDDTLRRDPSSMQAQEIHRRRGRDAQQALQQIALGSARAEDELLRAIADMLAGESLFRRLIGPALVMIGIVVGTAANIGAS